MSGITEADYCPCGNPLVRHPREGARYCISCGRPEFEVEVAVRIAGGKPAWMRLEDLRVLLREAAQ